jgi:hypothetical protein
VVGRFFFDLYAIISSIVHGLKPFEEKKKKILTTKSLVICHLRPLGKTFLDYLASASIPETMGSNKVVVEDLFQLMI